MYSFPIAFFLTEESLCEPRLTRRETSWHSPHVRYYKEILDYGSHVVDSEFYAAESGFQPLDSSPGCFLVLRKPFLYRFCFVGWVLFSVFSILYITSLMWWLSRPQQEETKDSLSVKPGFQILNVSEIPDSLSWILNCKALVSGSHQQNFTWVDLHNMAMQNNHAKYNSFFEMIFLQL